MLEKIFSDVGFIASQKSLDFSSLRQKVISNNIANVNTPGFKRSDVSFAGKLQDAMGEMEDGTLKMAATNFGHFFAGKQGSVSFEEATPEITSSGSISNRYDENNVDIDVEMANLAENTINYQTFTRLLGEKFRGLSSVISEGKR